MLILTRRPLDSIMVILPEGTRLPDGTVLRGDDCIIQYTTLGVKGNQVRVGVKAHKGLPVHREEIYDAIKQEQAQGRNRGGFTSHSAMAK